MGQHTNENLSSDSKEVIEKGAKAINGVKKVKKASKALKLALKNPLVLKIIGMATAGTVAMIFFIATVTTLILLPSAIMSSGEEIQSFPDAVSTAFTKFSNEINDDISFSVSNFFAGLVDKDSADEMSNLRNQLQAANKAVAQDDNCQEYLDVSNLLTSTITTYFERRYIESISEAKSIADNVRVDSSGTQLLNGDTVAFDSSTFDWNDIIHKSTARSETTQSYNGGATCDTYEEGAAHAKNQVPKVYVPGTITIAEPTRSDVSTGDVSYMDPSFYVLAYQSAVLAKQASESGYEPTTAEETLTTYQIIDKANLITLNDYSNITSENTSGSGTASAESKAFLVKVTYTISYSYDYQDETHNVTVLIKHGSKGHRAIEKYLVYDDTKINVTVNTDVKYAAIVNPLVAENIRNVFGVDENYANTVAANIENMRKIYKIAIANAGLSLAPSQVYAGIDYSAPLASYTYISTYFGQVDGTHPTPHKGIDLADAAGQPIYAAASGTVVEADYQPAGYGGYGNVVVIDHGTGTDGNSYRTLYAHMSSISVHSGEYVERGQIIGCVGSTGVAKDGTPTSTGPHLHFEVRQNGVQVDPSLYVNLAQ
jgi:murein DD-endopeptidase MepM/ murein hydrolase activator NlpD